MINFVSHFVCFAVKFKTLLHSSGVFLLAAALQSLPLPSVFQHVGSSTAAVLQAVHSMLPNGQYSCYVRLTADGICKLGKMVIKLCIQAAEIRFLVLAALLSYIW